MMSYGKSNWKEVIPRILAGLVGIFFLLTGIGFLTIPEVLASSLFVEPARAVGINSIRGDFGGMFLGMGVFCLLGVLTRYRGLLMIPIVFLALILTGRLISIFVDDVPLVAGNSIAMEVLFLIILLLAVKASAAKNGVPEKALRIRDFFNYRLLAAIATAVILVAGVFGMQKHIGMSLLNVIAGQFSRVDVVRDLPDGLHAALVGAGAPMPDARRSGPCSFVIAGKSLFVVDAGPGSIHQMELMKLPLGDVQAVLLTHFHSDHIGGLGELMLKRWAGGANKEALAIYGPQGVQAVVDGFNLAYSNDFDYRVAHHGPQTTPPGGAGGMARPFDVSKDKQEGVIIDENGVKVTAFLVDHRPAEPAVGYRFDYKGRSLVISGDTLPNENLRKQAKGADLLMHDALQPTMVRALSQINRASGRSNIARISTDILDYHTFPEEAARIAAEAGVRHLVFYHIIPPLPVSALKTAFLGDAREYYTGPITVGVDGMLFSLPAGSTRILKAWQW